MERLRSHARRHGLDVLIVLAALESALDVALAGDGGHAPRSTAWFAAPAAAAIALPLLARRRFPFAAPASVWLLGAAVSFVDGRIVVFRSGHLRRAGMAAALLLGNLAVDVQARAGWPSRSAPPSSSSTTTLGHAAGEFVFVPGCSRSPGSPASRCASGHSRPRRRRSARSRAEREREAAARIAVAEERSAHRARAARRRRPRASA